MIADSQHFDFKQHWTCQHLVFDVVKGYICQKTAQQFKRNEIVQPTNFAHWKRG